MTSTTVENDKAPSRIDYDSFNADANDNELMNANADARQGPKNTPRSAQSHDDESEHSSWSDEDKNDAEEDDIAEDGAEEEEGEKEEKVPLKLGCARIHKLLRNTTLNDDKRSPNDTDFAPFHNFATSHILKYQQTETHDNLDRESDLADSTPSFASSIADADGGRRRWPLLITGVALPSPSKADEEYEYSGLPSSARSLHRKRASDDLREVYERDNGDDGDDDDS